MILKNFASHNLKEQVGDTDHYPVIRGKKIVLCFVTMQSQQANVYEAVYEYNNAYYSITDTTEIHELLKNGKY